MFIFLALALYLTLLSFVCLNAFHVVVGYTWKPVITVHVYRRDDGINVFLNSLPDIISSGIDSLDIKKLDAFLRKYFNAPDPDFALVCGDVLSYFGFPPWCLRITQIE